MGVASRNVYRRYGTEFVRQCHVRDRKQFANVGTAGFKSSRAIFCGSWCLRRLRAAPAGSDRWVFLNDVQANFAQGSMTTTGHTFDLAMDGDRFYLLRDSADTDFYRMIEQFKVDDAPMINAGGSSLQLSSRRSRNIADTIGNITLTSMPSPRKSPARRPFAPISMPMRPFPPAPLTSPIPHL